MPYPLYLSILLNILLFIFLYFRLFRRFFQDEGLIEKNFHKKQEKVHKTTLYFFKK
ncbi:hypothetical protein HMPREF6123_1127 [Oribacterium sinus F0268]|uniref:Uncharacterized protein n=1 Tax=Oribacterium sinus F0268 TaxID=585501 RepID=C2KXA8_9FIRM|nr:hypothetical protein HMPREF6123_1127 [Oribacterium sinus F0268]